MVHSSLQAILPKAHGPNDPDLVKPDEEEIEKVCLRLKKCFDVGSWLLHTVLAYSKERVTWVATCAMTCEQVTLMVTCAMIVAHVSK